MSHKAADDTSYAAACVNLVFACGSKVLVHFLLFGFALRVKPNNDGKRMYHAAAGSARHPIRAAELV